MPFIEVKFPVRGKKVVSDHGYFLYAALSKAVPNIHDWDDLSICGISGTPDKFRTLHLSNVSKLRIRVEQSKLSGLLRLAGKKFQIGEDSISLGIPNVQLLKPHRNLYSRLVLIKLKEEVTHENFLEAVKRQLDVLEIRRDAVLFYDKNGEPFVRKTMHIKGKEIVGYPMILTELTPEESIRLQEQGIGGKRKMGCGSFVGVK
jgi:CRISPR-associated protein Cas6